MDENKDQKVVLQELLLFAFVTYRDAPDTLRRRNFGDPCA